MQARLVVCCGSTRVGSPRKARSSGAHHHKPSTPNTRTPPPPSPHPQAAFHPLCARRIGNYLTQFAKPGAPLGTKHQYKAYCHVHSESARARDQQQEHFPVRGWAVCSRQAVGVGGGGHLQAISS